MKFCGISLLLLGLLLAPTLSAGQTPSVLELYCEADEHNPYDPNANVQGPGRPRAVTLRVDFVARTVEMRDRGELLARQSGVVATESTIKWGTGQRGLDTQRGEGGLHSAFDGTIDRMAGHVVVIWDRGGGRWRYNGFAGKCKLAPKVPKY